ncbi:MAG TPA: HAMP domain-containing sensor histidine kinase [Ktedonobacteraceae bacterium]
MRFRKTLTALFVDLPFRLRLGIVVLSYLLCLALFAWVFLPSHNGSILSIPLALSCWMFKRRGALIGFGCTILALIVFNSFSAGSLVWPPSLALAFLSGSLALLVEAAVISLLRHALDMAQALDIAQAAQRKAQQAEQQLALAYKDQRQLNDLKDQFLLHVSHELRTPLTAVSGYLELLSEYHEHMDAATRATFLDNARSDCQELIRMVDDVLNATQASSEVNPLQLEVCSVAQVVQEVLQHLDPREVQAYHLQIEIPEHFTIWADRHYVRQVLRNLLSNAFKYAPKQTTLVISATLHEPATQVCMSVKDAGPGIPPAELPLLFGKFVRLKRDLAGTVPGSGLGLYVSKQFVEAMGGHIWAESSGRAGEGSRFCFTLPAASPASLQARTHNLISSL